MAVVQLNGLEELWSKLEEGVHGNVLTNLMLLLEVKSYLMWTTLKLFSKIVLVSVALSLRSSSSRISNTNSSQSEEDRNPCELGIHDMSQGGYLL